MPQIGIETTSQPLADALAAKSAVLPSGLIVMWSGLLSAIPAGWALCSGANGTPDLRDKFIYGCSNGVDPGPTGGAATHTHASHSYTPAGTNAGGAVQSATTGITVGDHSYTPQGTVSAHTVGTTFSLLGLATGLTGPSNHTFTGTGATLPHTVGDSGHTHTFTQPTFTGTAASLGHDTASNLPPYFRLAFIMKL